MSFADLESPMSEEEFDSLWNLLTSKFKNEVQLIKEGDLEQGNAWSEVVNGVIKVHIPKYSKSISYTTLAEEILHPVIFTIQKQNPKLFERFLNECRNSKDKNIQLIYASVQNNYKDKSQSVRDNEFVTQSLSYLLKMAKVEKPSVFRRFINAVCDIINSIGIINVSPKMLSIESFAYALKFKSLQIEVANTMEEYDHISSEEYE